MSFKNQNNIYCRWKLQETQVWVCKSSPPNTACVCWEWPLLSHSGKVASCGVLKRLERLKFLLSGPSEKVPPASPVDHRQEERQPGSSHAGCTIQSPVEFPKQISARSPPSIVLEWIGLGWRHFQNFLVIPARAGAESRWISEGRQEGLNFPSDSRQESHRHGLAWSIVNCSLSLEGARQLLRLKEREKSSFLSMVLLGEFSFELLSWAGSSDMSPDVSGLCTWVRQAPWAARQKSLWGHCSGCTPTGHRSCVFAVCLPQLLVVSQGSGEKTTLSQSYSWLTLWAPLAQDVSGTARLLWAIIEPGSFSARLNTDNTAHRERAWGMNSKYEASEFFFNLVSFLLICVLYPSPSAI